MRFAHLVWLLSALRQCSVCSPLCFPVGLHAAVHFFAFQWGLPVVCTAQCSGNVLECTDRKAKACSSSSATRGSCRWQRCHHLCHLLCHQAFVLSATFISIALQILQLPALQLPSLAVKLCRRHLNLQLPSLSTNIDAKSQSRN